ncbi:hypothetical protein [Polynucleobacter alcilacus]|uniref:hypothetical protein n=1 Tax=Polynucleobacter alcilacus TaxID=1819739 RepID=UPI001C0B2BE0|nr:hypothetical protein [Polynucleobacter alcilacus]MBU3568574.1 hypothetical protein [Polynucleobacter alcilacus]
MSQINNPQKILDEVEAQEKKDKFLAIKTLQKGILDFPENEWLNLKLVYLYKSVNDLPNAKLVSNKIFEINPTFSNNWSFYLALNENDSKTYLESAYLMSNYFLEGVVRIETEWQARLFFEILVASSNIKVLERRNTLNELSKYDIDPNLLISIIIFLNEIKIFLSKPESKFNCWTLIVSDSSEAIFIKDNIAFINLSSLNILDLISFNDFTVRCLLNFFRLRFDTVPFWNDYSISSYSSNDPHLQPHRYLFLNLHARILRYFENIKNIQFKNISFEKNKMYIRAGNVELYSIAAFINNPLHSESILNTTIPYLIENNTNIVPIKANQTWWPRNNFLDSLLFLWTNAGWYVTKNESPLLVFKEFMQSYVDALNSGYVINTYLPELQLLHQLVDINYDNVVQWNPVEFLKSINGKNILFITPFAAQINESYRSGKLFQLYNDYGLNIKFNLSCIEAPVTTYPNIESSSWIETLEKMKTSVDNHIIANETDFFISSCGCYGIPLSAYVYKKHSITTVYFGHIANFYFGIMTNAFDGYRLSDVEVESKHWTIGNLSEKYPLIDKIDDGRYI